MTKKEAFNRAEQLRAQSGAAYSRATDALMQGNLADFDQDNGQAHNLRNEASGEYARAGVRLDHGGKPFGPDVKRLK